MKKITALILSVVVIFSNVVYANSNLSDMMTVTEKVLSEKIEGNIGEEWVIIGLGRNGDEVDVTENYYKNLLDYLDENDGILSERKYTEYSRTILALTTIGKNPQDVGGYNLLMPLADYNATLKQGINGAIWALLAFDCGNYDVPFNEKATVQATREMYIEKIIASQLSDGGWAMTGDVSDVDLTAMAVQSLSAHRDGANVKNSIDKALSFLSQSQNANGGYESDGLETAESISQVIVALCSLGISTNDERFVKNGKTLIDRLGEYYTSNGFEHILGGGVNQMATEQAFYAMVALKRFENGEKSLYDMTAETSNIETYKPIFKKVVGTLFMSVISVL